MENPPQQNHDTPFRDTGPGLISVAHNGFSASYPFNDPASTWSVSSHAGSSYPPSNMISPQSIPTHCTFAPVQISYYPSPCGQAQLRHESLPQPRYNVDARDSNTVPFSQQHPSGTEPSDLQIEAPNWFAPSILSPGQSLSVSQLESTDSEHAGWGCPQSYRNYTADLTEHDAGDDEGSDTMSDGIASDEGVYYSSGSDRDAFDDDDFGSFGAGSDEEYVYDSDDS